MESDAVGTKAENGPRSYEGDKCGAGTGANECHSFANAAFPGDNWPPSTATGCVRRSCKLRRRMAFGKLSDCDSPVVQRIRRMSVLVEGE